MNSYYAPIARLLGDLVVSLPPLQSLIEGGEQISLILRSPAQEGLSARIPGLKDSIRERDFLKLSGQEIGRLINLRDHPLQKDFVWGSAEFESAYPNYRISEVIKDICRDLGINDGQDRLIPLNWRIREESKNKVILIPGTAGPIKRWPSRYWLELHRKLSEAGIDSAMLGQAEQNTQIAELAEAGIPWLGSPKLTDALDLISSSRAVVSVDTGLMHLAVHQGIQTVAVFREYTMFLRPYPNVRYLVAPKCATACREQEFNFAPNAEILYKDWDKSALFEYWSGLHCRVGKESGCMELISVESVLETLSTFKLV